MDQSEQNAVPGLEAIPESATRPAQVQLPEPAALREPGTRSFIRLNARSTVDLPLPDEPMNAVISFS